MVLFVFWMAACSSEVVSPPAKVTETKANSESSVPRASTVASSSEIAAIRKFAEAYEPRSSGRQIIPSPPTPPNDVSTAIDHLASVQSREHEKYIILIFLKIERFHIEHFKQGYELGREGLLTQEFYRLIGKANYKDAEAMLSGLASGYVDQHSELRDYSPVAKEMDRIAKAGKRIAEELRTTEQRQSAR